MLLSRGLWMGVYNATTSSYNHDDVLKSLNGPGRKEGWQ